LMWIVLLTASATKRASRAAARKAEM
jgi:hypothetical protein